MKNTVTNSLSGLSSPTTRLTAISNNAASAQARGLPTELYAVGMRQILEAHPEVQLAKAWREIAASYG